MSRRDDIFPNKYLKAADLNDEPLVAKIVRAPDETLKNPDGKEELKTVLYFANQKKCLPLNRTNWDACADICGDDTEDWQRHSVELYPTTTQMGNKTVDCIRIRPPPQRSLPMQKAKRAKAPAKAKPTLEEEMDDEIPFRA